MNVSERLDGESAVAGMADSLDSDLLEALTEHPVDCVETEYPHTQFSVESPDAVADPSEQHPVFFGCFDWHSAVHSHWCLIRQLRLFEDHPRREEIIESIDGRLTEKNVQGEGAYFEENRTFEKPYGWAWLLRLVAELTLWDQKPGPAWRRRLEPLESQIVSLVETEFFTQNRPFRVGTHQNSAFALAFILDYARTVGNESLASGAEEVALDFFAEDRDYPVEFEPFGWDFLSPALTEADLMRRVLPAREFAEWVDDFFPDLARGPYDSVFDPFEVDPDPEDLALHLVGMNLSKAWCLAGLAETLDDHRYADRFAESAVRHANEGLELAFTDDYAGSH
jgi:hypothetical protein